MGVGLIDWVIGKLIGGKGCVVHASTYTCLLARVAKPRTHVLCASLACNLSCGVWVDWGDQPFNRSLPEWQPGSARVSFGETDTHPLSRVREQPLLVSGGFTHPAGAVLAAAWEGPPGQGRLMVLGSSEVWGDEWLEREGSEGNAALAEAAVAVRAFPSCLCR